MDSIKESLSVCKSTEDVVGALEIIVKDTKVLMFGKESCPFCIEANSTLLAQGVRVSYIKMGEMSNSNIIHGALKEHTKQKTFPYIYITGAFIGGCNELKSLEQSQALDSMLASAMEVGANIQESRLITGADVRATPVVSTLFNFPDTLDNRVIRMNGLQGFAVALLGAVFKGSKTMHWIVLFLFVDFTLRFLGGGGMSPIALNGQIVTGVMEYFGSKPKFSPGPPKQFASFCGMMFSGLGALFLLLDHSSDDSWCNWLGAAWLLGLAGAAGMEGFLDFCVGCLFFGWGIRLGIFPPHVYTVHLNTKAETENTWNVMNTRLNEGPPKFHRVHQKSHPEDTLVDRLYKEKTEEQSREDFHLVKHCKLMYSICPLVLLALAVVWKSVRDLNPFLNTKCLRLTADVLAILAIVVYCMFIALWMARVFMFPKKCWKEWTCPVMFQLHCVPAIGLLFIAMLAEPHTEVLARVCFWIGAVSNLVISVMMLGRWVFDLRDWEHISPTLLIPTIGNFLSAAVLPLVSTAEDKDLETAFMWFGFGFFTFLSLFPICLYKALVNSNSDPVMRPILFITVATPATAAAALFAIQGPLWLIKSLFFFALLLLAVMVFGFWPARFFGAGKFHMSSWGYGFGLCALTLGASQYHTINDCATSRRLLVTALSMSSWACVVLVQSTISALVRRQVFTPENKWGPMSFMRLTHEAFRDIIPRITQAAASEEGASSLATLWARFVMLHDAHSWHEDTIIFPTAARYFPGVADVYNEEHAGGHNTIAEITGLVTELNQAHPKLQVLPHLKTLLHGFLKSMEDHLKSEETHIQPIIRKYLPIEMHKEVIRRCFKETEIELLFKYVPAVLMHLPHPTQRERFVRTFLWAMPESAQHLGLMISIGVSPVMWYQLSKEIPDIIPRGLPGWKRFH
eukprot:CAMPEP_0196572832 /NCGR_PEP_ID=MMETSP1081-20130531/2808_1 /TAXON_ID=36882 /ORGANISM="Pyramimonas amylifera, Strain CCMP720" /LENGTH=910 /DNA_ID=CAMNT_0041890289 /DNA_START=61 /DNA_END=2793 /DNA_ORIENTATION=+